MPSLAWQSDAWLCMQPNRHVNSSIGHRHAVSLPLWITGRGTQANRYSAPPLPVSGWLWPDAGSPAGPSGLPIPGGGTMRNGWGAKMPLYRSRAGRLHVRCAAVRRAASRACLAIRPPSDLHAVDNQWRGEGAEGGMYGRRHHNTASGTFPTFGCSRARKPHKAAGPMLTSLIV